MPEKKPKLVVIDGNAIIHRAWHALPPTLRTAKGELVNAVYGFTSILLRVLKELKPTYVAVTFDAKGPTFRHTKFAAYKAQRVKKPDEFYAQFDRVREVVRAFNIPIFELSGYEADDLIGTIVTSKQAAAVHRIIVTGDMDTLQLVGPDVSVFALHQGITDAITYTPSGVRERFGIDPIQLIDFKALRGDPSDNIPGVKGIGEKTATDLLQRFGSLKDIYKNLKDERIPQRVRTLLKEHKAEAMQAKELVQIVHDAPIKFSLAACELADYTPSTVAQLFSELEFKSLMSRLPTPLPPSGASQGTLALGATPALRPRLNSAHYQLIDTEDKFSAFLKELQAQKLFAIDTETSSLDPLSAKLVGISISWQDGHAAFVLPKPEWLAALAPILANAKIGKVGHNIKFDLHSLTTAGLPVAGIAFDTMVASYLLNPGSRAHGLDVLAFAEFGAQMTPITDLIGKGAQQRSMADVPLDEVTPYACADADYTWRLLAVLRKDLESKQQIKLLETIELPLIPVLASMERAGVKLDTDFLAEMSTSVGAQIAQLETSIHRSAGGPFNINSPLQLKEVLFGKLAISAMGLGRTKTGISTAADELEKLADAHPIIGKIMEYRELTKLRSTYLDALPLQVASYDNRVHTSYSQTIAATGRLSSSDPNLQNIPIRTPLGGQIRKAFIAERGFAIVSADYNQIELRLIASLAQDPTMIDTFLRGEDVHTRTASELHDVPVEQVDKALRRTAKEVNFGIIYGMGSSGLAQRQHIPRDKARAFIDKYFALHPKIAEYLETTKQAALVHGFVETIFGRRRYLPEIAASAPQIRSAAERAAINHPVQGTAADLMKLAMIAVHAKLPDVSPKSRMIMQVHDELVFEVPTADVPKVASLVKQTMEDVHQLRVPILVHVGAGKNWGELKPVAA